MIGQDQQKPNTNPAFITPTINLPKGGAICGMGEKFAANPVNGTGSLSVPIATSLGCSSFGPQLGLSYDSGSGNDPFGFGWSLSIPSIIRKTDKGIPQHLDADEPEIYILSGAEDLMPALQPNGIGSSALQPNRPSLKGISITMRMFILPSRYDASKNNGSYI